MPSSIQLNSLRYVILKEEETVRASSKHRMSLYVPLWGRRIAFSWVFEQKLSGHYPYGCLPIRRRHSIVRQNPFSLQSNHCYVEFYYCSKLVNQGAWTIVLVPRTGSDWAWGKQLLEVMASRVPAAKQIVPMKSRMISSSPLMSLTACLQQVKCL